MYWLFKSRCDISFLKSHSNSCLCIYLHHFHTFVWEIRVFVFHLPSCTRSVMGGWVGLLPMGVVVVVWGRVGEGLGEERTTDHVLIFEWVNICVMHEPDQSANNTQRNIELLLGFPNILCWYKIRVALIKYEKVVVYCIIFFNWIIKKIFNKPIYHSLLPLFDNWYSWKITGSISSTTNAVVRWSPPGEYVQLKDCCGC